MSTKLAPRPFSTLGVKPFLWAETSELQQIHSEFLKLSRKFHPDLLQNASDETRAMQEAAASQLNTDYSKIKDFWKLVETVVHGVHAPEKSQASGSDRKASAPPALASDYFDLQELLIEEPEKAKAQFPAFKSKVAAELKSAQNAVEVFAKKFLFQGMGDAAAPWNESQLTELNSLLQKLRYFRSFSDDIDRKFR